jgi:hypothetical protein
MRNALTIILECLAFAAGLAGVLALVFVAHVLLNV